jgi:hypothetical protein
MGNVMANCPIKCGPICAGLSTRNDAEWLHAGIIKEDGKAGKASYLGKLMDSSPSPVRNDQKKIMTDIQCSLLTFFVFGVYSRFSTSSSIGLLKTTGVR